MSRRGLTLSNLLCPDHHARPRQAPRRGAPGSPRCPILGLAMHLRTLPVQQACPWLRGLSGTPLGIQDGDKEGFFFGLGTCNVASQQMCVLGRKTRQEIYELG